MKQTAIPYVFMRGGTSRGPYFNRAHLPDDLETLARVLIAAIGSGHPLNIDGIGGGRPVTTKVAMLSKSSIKNCDIDYFFAQVSVDDQQVDFKPSCGNILSGVAAASVELGLVRPTSDTTTVRIRAVNTNARVTATIETPDGVNYDGSTVIDGVPGSASPVQLQFMDTIGGVTGAFLPTGNCTDVFDGIEVTCMDVAMPMVIAKARSFGLSGYETVEELDNNAIFFQQMEAIRLQAGMAMGLGDVSQSVAPKFGLLAHPVAGGSMTCRYFMPWNCHPTMAVTGAQCLASCILTPNTVAADMAPTIEDNPATITLEHPCGQIDVIVKYERGQSGFKPLSAGLVRTARKLADGNVYIPANVWTGI
ncbi:MAG: 4-oxalomesaconate tautomerase [Granulosicoccus sp.]